MLGIEFIRKQKDMSISDVAKTLGISRQAVSMWESGKKPIPEDRLKQLAETFNLNRDYFSKDLSETEMYDILVKLKIEENVKYREEREKNLDEYDTKSQELYLSQGYDEEDLLAFEEMLLSQKLVFLKAIDEIKETFDGMFKNVNTDKALDEITKFTTIVVGINALCSQHNEEFDKLSNYMRDIIGNYTGF